MRPEWTILIDTREQKPLPFPNYLPIFDTSSHPTQARLRTLRIHTRVCKLDTGDYCLESHPDIGLIERKAHLAELHGNLCTSKGLAAFVRELQRFRNHRSPCILLENANTTVAPRSLIPGFNPTAVRDLLLINCISRGIPLYTFTATSLTHRIRCAEWAASYLIMAAIASELKTENPVLPIEIPPPAPSPPLSSDGL